MSEAKWLINLKCNIKTWVSIQRFPSLLSKHKHFTLTKKTKKTQNHSGRNASRQRLSYLIRSLHLLAENILNWKGKKKQNFTPRFSSELFITRKSLTLHTCTVWTVSALPTAAAEKQTASESKRAECTVPVPQAVTVAGARDRNVPRFPSSPSSLYWKIIKQKVLKLHYANVCQLNSNRNTHKLQELKLPGVMHSEVGWGEEQETCSAVKSWQYFCTT